MLLVDDLKDIIKGCLSGERRSQEKLYKLFFIQDVWGMLTILKPI